MAATETDPTEDQLADIRARAEAVKQRAASIRGRASPGPPPVRAREPPSGPSAAHAPVMDPATGVDGTETRAVLSKAVLFVGIVVGTIVAVALMYGMQATMTAINDLRPWGDEDAAYRHFDRLAPLGGVIVAAAVVLAGVLWVMGGAPRWIALGALVLGAAVGAFYATEAGGLIGQARVLQDGIMEFDGAWWPFFFGAQLAPLWAGPVVGPLLAVRGLWSHYGTLRLKAWDRDLFVALAAALVAVGTLGGIGLVAFAVYVT